MNGLWRAAVRAVYRVRAAEPAWLATKRKAIVGPVTGFVVAGVAHRLGRDLTSLELELIGAGVAGVVSWAIPNKPATM